MPKHRHPNWGNWDQPANADYPETPLTAKYRRYPDPFDDKYYYFSDPTPDIVSAFNQYMLRAGALATSWQNKTDLVDPGVAIHQTVPGQTLPLVYQSDLRWFAGAVCIQWATVLLMLPMFWGWWTLGRNLSLSPFAIALAFDSPLLQDVNSAKGSRGVVEALGSMRVKFGSVRPPEVEKCDEIWTARRGGDAAGRLGIAEVRSVDKPMKGERFSR